MPDKPAEEPFRFGGFHAPHYTQVPNELFDDLLARLSGAELKVLLYIVRRTFGFQKDADAISLKQLVSGIVTRDGRRLDAGTGLAESSVIRARDGLVEKHIIVAERRTSPETGDETTVYRLNIIGDPVSQNARPPTSILQVAPLAKEGTQQKDDQNKEGVYAARLKRLAADRQWPRAAPATITRLASVWATAEDADAWFAQAQRLAPAARDLDDLARLLRTG